MKILKFFLKIINILIFSHRTLSTVERGNYPELRALGDHAYGSPALFKAPILKTFPTKYNNNYGMYFKQL